MDMYGSVFFTSAKTQDIFAQTSLEESIFSFRVVCNHTVKASLISVLSKSLKDSTHTLYEAHPVRTGSGYGARTVLIIRSESSTPLNAFTTDRSRSIQGCTLFLSSASTTKSTFSVPGRIRGIVSFPSIGLAYRIVRGQCTDGEEIFFSSCPLSSDLHCTPML